VKELLTKYKRDLTLKGYSPKTCEHYFRDVKQFLEYYNLPISEIDTEKIKNYLFYLISERKASDSKIRISHSAIRYFFMQTLERPWEAGGIPYVYRKTNSFPVFPIIG
jgi:site-specific recombinase XerD